MTQLLERAFQEAAKLPPEEQDLLANRMLAELAEEQSSLTEGQKQELDRRLAAHQADPSNVVLWERIKADALARLQR